MQAKLVSKKESKEARQRAHRLINKIRNHNKIKGRYKFYHVLIGSGSRKCIIKDNKGKYDLDFQIVLTKNSPETDKNPTQIKEDFFQAFVDNKNHNEKAENSTTVVTVRASKSKDSFDAQTEKFSFDFVIISIDQTKRIRRNGQNIYTWVELPSRHSDIYKKFRKLSCISQRNLLETKIIPRIIDEKQKNEAQRIPSVHIFFEEVNNYKDDNHAKKQFYSFF